MSTSELFLVALLIVVSLPYLVWRLGRTDYWAPLVVVQIVAGIMLGPGVLGKAAPAVYAGIFTAPVIGMLGGIAQWAVMLFVWVAGLELDLRQAWARRGETGLTAALALGVPLAAGSLAAVFLLSTGPGWIAPGARPWQAVAGIGMACAVTALPILILLLEKLELLRRPLGQRVLRYASLDDVAIWAVLAFILLDWERVGRQAGFLVGFAVAAVLVRRLIPRLKLADRWYAALIWLAGCGFVADWSGLHFMVGAFLSGAVLDGEWFETRRADDFRATILFAVMPVFFLSTGLKTSWSLGGASVFAAAALLLGASVLGKLAGTAVAGRLLGWGRGEATTIGLLLQTKALIMIIFVNVLLDKHIVSPATFTALLLMAVASTMLTVPAVTPRLRRAGAALADKG